MVQMTWWVLTKLRCLFLCMFLVRKSHLIHTISKLEHLMFLYIPRLSCFFFFSFSHICAQSPIHMKSNLSVVHLFQLRVSSILSNSSYILILDCDMYCNDSTSARQAMCFHLDPKISPSLAFVQFPQKFHNISKTDIYDSQLRITFMVR